MDEEKILNTGLEFAMEFGSNWLQPIHSRLSNKFPKLNSVELTKYDSICRKAMKDGHDYFNKTLKTAADKNKKINEKEIAGKLKSFLHKKYPWIDSENLGRILSQGFYYAMK